MPIQSRKADIMEENKGKRTAEDEQVLGGKVVQLDTSTKIRLI